MSTNNSSPAYQKVTDALIESLQSGVAPWRRPWSGTVPMNGETHRPYRGINMLVLGCAPFADPRWLTFKSVERLGGKVQKGAKSRPMVFWKFWEQKDPATGEVIDRVPILRYYSVFNVEQAEGLKLKPLSDLIPTGNHSPIAAAEVVFATPTSNPRFGTTSRRKSRFLLSITSV